MVAARDVDRHLAERGEHLAGVAVGLREITSVSLPLARALRAALDPRLVAFGSTLRVVADEDRLPERDHARQRTD